MHPLLWLDYTVALIAILGILLAIVAACTEQGPSKARRKFHATWLIAAALMLGGWNSLWTHRIASRLSFTGTVIALERHGGKHAMSYLTLRDRAGSTCHLSMDVNLYEVNIGDSVTAEWTAYNARITNLTILTGTNAGQSLRDTSPFYAMLFILLGLFFGWGANRQLRNNPNALPVEDPRQPLNGVDEDSLLRLNK